MPITSLHRRKCLITGAASGIGRATAEMAARQGAELFLTDINAEGLAEVAAGIRAAGCIVNEAHALDISQTPAVQAWADAIHHTHGSLDVLMNIAGISVWGAIEDLRFEHWQRCVDINLMGPIHVMNCFIPAMIKAGKGGHVVNVASAAGLFGLPLHAPCSASKFGLRGVSEVLRFDLARHGIGVSLVCPGAVDTGLVQTVEIPGVDGKAPDVVALRQRFQKRAVPPEVAAQAILQGMRQGRYMVFTSWDIRLGYLLQHWCPWLYEWAMARLNDHLYAVTSRNRTHP